ncbi:MAG: alpha/beta fold hydrolase [Burkholderiales bacterium]
MREGQLNFPGVKLWYRDQGGSGEPVVFMHAATGHAGFFESSQIPVFAAAGYRPIVYDRRGYGRTVCEGDAVKEGSAAQDLLALVNELGLERFHLIGTAGGGIICLDFALGHAQRLISLVVANSLGGAQDADFLALCNGLRPPQFNILPDDFKELGPEFRAAQSVRLDLWRVLAQSTLAGGTRAASQAMQNKITFSALEKLRLPTLFLTGDADLYSPPAIVKRYANCIPAARFQSVAEVGHSLYWEMPAVFNEIVLKFIGNANGLD